MYACKRAALYQYHAVQMSYVCSLACPCPLSLTYGHTLRFPMYLSPMYTSATTPETREAIRFEAEVDSCYEGVSGKARQMLKSPPRSALYMGNKLGR